jgi:hypothetical protein
MMLSLALSKPVVSISMETMDVIWLVYHETGVREMVCGRQRMVSNLYTDQPKNLFLAH